MREFEAAADLGHFVREGCFSSGEGVEELIDGDAGIPGRSEAATLEKQGRLPDADWGEPEFCTDAGKCLPRPGAQPFRLQ